MFSKWVQSTSMNGATDWYESRTKTPYFLFWTFVMLTMISCCLFFTYKTVEDYFIQPTQTTMHTYQVTNMDMPEILICFNGGLNIEAMRQSGFSIEFIKNLNGFMKYRIFDSNLSGKMDQEIKEYLKEHDINMKLFMQNFTFSCKDIYRNSSKVNCGKNTYSLYSTFFGQCNVFRNNEKQYYPGIDGGIHIHLKTPLNSFYEYAPSLATHYTWSNSFSISLDNKFSWITRRSLLIPANVRAEITLHPTRYIRSASSNPCDDGENIYSSNTCFHRCYANSMYDFCGCYLLEYLDSEDEFNYTNICTPFNTICANYTDQIAQPCREKCRPKCDEWVYGTTVTYAFLGPKPINKSVSIVSIGYNTMEYAQVEEVDSFTIYTGLANVGGQAGLWLGISIVTVLQGLYYIILSLCKYFHGAMLMTINPPKKGMPPRSSESKMPAETLV